VKRSWLCTKSPPANATTMTLMAKAEQLRQDVMAWAALAGVDVRLLDLPGPMQ
jgi:hypothetical protein